MINMIICSVICQFGYFKFWQYFREGFVIICIVFFLVDDIGQSFIGVSEFFYFDYRVSVFLEVFGGINVFFQQVVVDVLFYNCGYMIVQDKSVVEKI